MNALQEFLQRYTPHSEDTAIWQDGEITLRMVSYFCAELPPLEYVNSVRGIVLRGQEVLVMRNADGTHIMPGGRREQDESLAETLQRELLEEAGWLTDNYHLLGVIHFHHLSPKPVGYPYLYPDFVNLIYRASALEQRPAAKLVGDYELEERFVALEELLKSNLMSAGELQWLQWAVSAKEIGEKANE